MRYGQCLRVIEEEEQQEFCLRKMDVNLCEVIEDEVWSVFMYD